jgi:photosystem II stability/assembly factor-like uncharacterized protein
VFHDGVADGDLPVAGHRHHTFSADAEDGSCVDFFDRHAQDLVMKRALLAILLPLAIAPVQAQWNRVGPPGGGVNVVRFAGSRMVVAADGGVFASDDRGASWRPLFHLVDADASLLTVSGDTLYAAFAGRVSGEYFKPSRLFKSSDAGATWRELTHGLPGEKWIRALTVDPLDGSTLYLGLGCHDVSLKTGCDTCAAFVSPAGVGLYKSVDGGETWTLSSSGLSDVQLCIRGIAADPASSRIYAYSENYQGTFFVRRSASTNAAASWDVVNDANAPSRDLMVHPRTGRRFALSDTPSSASVVTSDDGATWRSVTTHLAVPINGGFAVDPDDDASIYAAAEFGLYHSPDRGETWTQLASSARYGTGRGVVVDPADPRRIYFASSTGLFASADHGVSWTESLLGQVANITHQLAFDPAHPGWIYATVGGFYPEHVARSRDGGRSWETINDGIEGQLAPPLAVAADGALFGIDTPNQRAVIRFDGTSWTRLPFPTIFPDTINADPVDPTTLYVTTFAKAIYKTTDRGATWRQINPGSLGSGLTRLLADPSGLYAYNLSIARSGDRGETWRTLSTLNDLISLIAIVPLRPATLYVTAGNRFQRSDDGGVTWTTLPQPPQPMVALAADPQSRNIVYVATTNRGIFRSTDGGVTFSDFNDDLPTRLLSGMAVDPRTRAVFALTAWEGVFARTVGPRRRAAGR